MSFNKQSAEGSTQATSSGWQVEHGHETQRQAGDTDMYARNIDNPWGPQAGYLQNIFGAAQGLYNQSQGLNNQAVSGLQDVSDISRQELDRARAEREQAGASWENIMRRQEAATGRYDQLVSDILGTGMTDIQGQAAQFAGQNPYLDQAVDTSWQNAEKMLGRALGGPGGIDHAASLGGNASSSRAGVAEGLAASEMADAAQQNELALRQAAYDQGLGQANTMYAGQQNMAAMLEQNPAQMAAILSGGQAADLGYQGIINPALQNMAQGSVGAAQQQWAPIQNFYDILGSNNWGGESTRTGRTVEDAFMSSNSKTDVRAAGNEVGRTKESGSDFGFNLGNFFSF